MEYARQHQIQRWSDQVFLQATLQHLWSVQDQDQPYRKSNLLNFDFQCRWVEILSCKRHHHIISFNEVSQPSLEKADQSKRESETGEQTLPVKEDRSKSIPFIRFHQNTRVWSRLLNCMENIFTQDIKLKQSGRMIDIFL